MSPGVTFERVYRELKRRLADGTLRPGQPIEPAAMSAELAASVTPIRDALHRLVGERLVEAPNHNGFRVPRPSEVELRDLYLWNGRLLDLAVRQVGPDTLRTLSRVFPDTEIDGATADLFLRIAKATSSAEHARTVARLNDRLAPCRRVERQVLGSMAEELGAIRALVQAGERSGLNRALVRYHQRRAAATPHILAAITAPS